MLLNIACSLCAQPIFRILLQQLRQQILQDGVGDEVQGGFLVAYLIFYLLKPFILDKKRREACDHLVQKITEGPPISKTAKIYPSLSEDLRR